MIKKSFNDNWQFQKGTDGMLTIPARSGDNNYITLPHDAMVLEYKDSKSANSNTTGFYPGGVYTYFKTFYISEEDSLKQVLFEFEGIYMNAMVYINGNLAGKRPFGYSNFYVNANNFLKYGQENEIKIIVKTDNMPNCRWYTGSGIYRNVNILKAELLHIQPEGLRITTISIDEGCAIIEAAATLKNIQSYSRNVRISINIMNEDGKVDASDLSPVTINAGESLIIRRHLLIPKVNLWNTDTPYLYSCVVKIIENQNIIDESVEKFGVRKLLLDPERGLRINNLPVKLRGACIHHDNGVIGACTFERAEERRAEILKNAGFNAIRSAHNPLSKAMLNACDNIGLLVIDEAFDTWTKCKSSYDYGIYFDEWWEKDIEAMVSKDYNHPSVIMYSIGNEIPETATAKASEINRSLVEKIKSLDSTRYVTNCVNGFLAAFPYMDKIIKEISGSDETFLSSDKTQAFEINQFMMNVFSKHDQIASSRTVGELLEEILADVDIAGYNYMDIRYEEDRKLYPNRIIVGSESYPPQIGTIWQRALSNSHVIGDFTWTGWDYIGESGVGIFDYSGNKSFFKPFPAYLAFCGDIDITGNRRPLSFYREITFGLRKDPYIAVQRVNKFGSKVNKTQWCGSDTISSWTWPGFEGKSAIVEIFSNSEEVELFLNDISIGKKKVGKEKIFTALFETIYMPGKLEAVSYNQGIETGRTQIETAGDKLFLKTDPDRTTLTANGSDLSYLMISLVDEKGNLNISKQVPITISLEGTGILQGFGSADPCTTENFFDSTRNTYDGKVLAVIRSTRKSGKINVTISSPVCDKVNIILQSI